MAAEQALLTQARVLADLSELAEDTVRILTGARAAGLDPAALGGLVGAAYALGANSITVYAAGRRQRGACPGEHEFLSALADLEDDIVQRLKAISHLRVDLAAARGDAQDALGAAQGMPVGDPCHGCHGARAAAIAAAQDRIAICEQVAGITDPLATMLRHALRRLRAVPADLGETYESVYDLIRSGGHMPRQGRWITGEDPQPQSTGTTPNGGRR